MRDLQALREKITNAQNELDQRRIMNRALADKTDVTSDEITKALEETKKLEARIQIMRDDLAAEEKHGFSPFKGQPEENRRSAILSSREYARAFRDAMREGVSIQAAHSQEKYRILLDAMTETGGNPAGSAGGFLVPADIDVTIRETMRNLVRLADLFDVQEVGSNTGTRTKDVAPTTGFTPLSGQAVANAVAEDDQPVFAQVPYSLTTYGLNIPVSNELVADEQADLFGYLGRFFAKKQIITENNLLLGILDDLTSQTAGTGETLHDILRRILNKVLDPDIALNAAIITNQSGFQLLDSAKDTNERPLLQPDPTTGTPMLFKAKPITVISDAMLPNPTGKDAVFYVGDFKQYGTLFVRQPLEIASTIEGGAAWRSYSTEVRGITRLAVAKFDTDAAACYTPASAT